MIFEPITTSVASTFYVVALARPRCAAGISKSTATRRRRGLSSEAVLDYIEAQLIAYLAVRLPSEQFVCCVDAAVARVLSKTCRRPCLDDINTSTTQLRLPHTLLTKYM